MNSTAETFLNGWVRTGDEVYFNEQKEIFVVDRIKELIKVRGFQVPPAELEGHLLDHPDVGDVCVVGIPDEYSGELPLAFVVTSANAIARIKADKREEQRIKDAIMKVRECARDLRSGLCLLTDGSYTVTSITPASVGAECTLRSTNREQHVADHKVNYKHLVAVEFLDTIPKNPSGKLLRRFLRDKAKQLKESGKLILPTRRKAKL